MCWLPVRPAVNEREIRNVKVELDTHEALSATAHGGNLCRIATGHYTGNGADNRKITGLGFDPKEVRVYYDNGAGSIYEMVIHDQFAAWTCFQTDGKTIYTDMVELITDGFEVNNSRGDDWLNVNAAEYYYTALG